MNFFVQLRTFAYTSWLSAVPVRALCCSGYVSTEPKTLPFASEPRQFSQARSRLTFEKLTDAATTVFAERGFDATQTPDIASVAQVSVGTFYRYFSDKREAFLEVIRRHLAEAHASVLSQLLPERFVAAGRRQTIEIAFKILVESVQRQPGLQRVFLEMSMRDAMVAKLRERYEGEGRKSLAALIAAICPKEDVADPEAMAYIIQTAAIQCAIALSGTLGTPPVSEERATKCLIDVLFRSLFSFELS